MARGPETATVLSAPRDDDPEANGDRCPSCDAEDTWRSSRRHRFSPFGSVTLMTLAAWAAILGWGLGFGYMPALVLALSGVLLALATRRAEVCEACGFVRPRRH